MLERLDVSHNEIGEIPSAYENLTKLTDFKFGNNKLLNIPQEIADLPSLKKLEGNGNLMIDLPSEFQPIPRNEEAKILEIFNFSRNYLKTIPEGIFKLGQLKKIDFSYNRINKVEIAKGTLPKLEELFLQGNKMTQLIIKGELPKLINLDVSDNCLFDLEIKGAPIERINISDSSFGKIPSFIFALPSLKVLIAKNIGISQIPDKPLKCEVNLSENNIQGLTIEGLDKLGSRLTLSKNFLSSNDIQTLESWEKKEKNLRNTGMIPTYVGDIPFISGAMPLFPLLTDEQPRFN